MNSQLKNLEKIHPLNRKRAAELAKYLVRNRNAKRIIVFGSSVTSRCNNSSDVDMYVELSEPIASRRLVDKLFHFPYDLWTNFQVDERLKNEIIKSGVVIFEKE